MNQLPVPLQKLEEPIKAYLKRKQFLPQQLRLFDKSKFESIFKSLGTDQKTGLRPQLVQKNQELYGLNKLSSVKSKTILQFFLQSLEDVMLRILIVAAIISIIVQAIYSEDKKLFWVEGVTILAAVFICSIVTTLNNYEKQKQFQDLSSLAEKSNKYEVIRNGQILQLHRQDIAAGDLVKLNAGSEVPADGIIVKALDLIVDESSMTGQTSEIFKNTIQKCQTHIKEKSPPSPIIMSGSNIFSGQGIMVCLLVGKSSRQGKYNELIIKEDLDRHTPLQQKLQKLAQKIGYFGLFSGIFLFLLLLVWLLINEIIPKGWNSSVHISQILKNLMLAITIVVVAVPEGLPLAVTLSLAFSVKQMLKQNNLVKRLACCETMGAARYICTDKTGTLTLNQMTVASVWNGKILNLEQFKQCFSEENSPYQQLIYQSIISNSTAILDPQPKGSPTQLAMLRFANKIFPDKNIKRQRQLLQKTSFLRFPFSSERKRISTGINVNNKQYLILSGAAQIIVQACSHNYIFRQDKLQAISNPQKLKSTIKQMSQGGQRLLALAFKQLTETPTQTDMENQDKFHVREIQKSNFTLLLLIGMSDIIRVQCKQAIKQCQKAGIVVVMVTGDNNNTARSVAIELGIIQQNDSTHNLCIQGQQFQKIPQNLSTSQLYEQIKDIRVLSRSQPQDKFKLVQMLKRLNNIVAVTGDGTNDAPALHKADVGIAMGKSGTQVAKDAADILILDDNFNSIIRSIVWGRNVYQNVKKFIQFQLTVNCVACIISILSSAFFRQSVLTTVQMLWLNLIMDSLASLALATEPPNTEELLAHKPANRDQSIISHTMLKHIIGQTIFQLTILIFLLLAGQNFLPQFADQFDKIIGRDLWAKYNNGQLQGTMVSGLQKSLFSSYSYKLSYNKYQVNSRHLTFVFNVFVFLQIFNFFNCRKIRDQINIFSGIITNYIFWVIILIVALLQWIIIYLLPKAFKLYDYHGLTLHQWFLSLLIAFTTIPFSMLLRILPFPKMDKNNQQYSDLIINRNHQDAK